jgi:hypothetical protein
VEGLCRLMMHQVGACRGLWGDPFCGRAKAITPRVIAQT